jgi:hypothetical protein
MAHSSGASRLALVHRTAQPGGGEASAGAASAWGVADGGVVCAVRGGALLDLGGCWARLKPIDPNATMAMTTASLAEILNERLPEKFFRD